MKSLRRPLQSHCVLICFVIASTLASSNLLAQVSRNGMIVDSTATRLNPVADEAIYTTAFHNLSFDKQGEKIAVGQGTGSVFIWDLEDHELIHQFKAHDDWAFSIEFFDDGKRIATGGGDSKVKLWNIEDLSKPTRVLERHTGDVHSVILADKENSIVTAGDDMIPIIETLGSASEANANDARPSYRMLEQHPRQIPAMDLSANGKLLATASRDGKIRVFDFKSGDKILELDAHEADCITVRFIGKTLNIVSGGYDGAIAVWNANMGYLVNRFKKLEGAVVCVDASPDGSTIVSVDNKGIVFNSVENPKSDPRLLSPEIASDEQLSFVRYHPEGKLVFVTTTLGRVLIVDVEKMKVVKTLTAPDPEPIIDANSKDK